MDVYLYHCYSYYYLFFSPFIYNLSIYLSTGKKIAYAIYYKWELIPTPEISTIQQHYITLIQTTNNPNR